VQDGTLCKNITSKKLTLKMHKNSTQSVAIPGIDQVFFTSFIHIVFLL